MFPTPETRGRSDRILEAMPYHNPDFGIVFVVAILLLAIFATLFPEAKTK